jgi:hypothetical protein
VPDLPTFSDLFRAARDQILSINPKISRDAVERDGADANIIIAGASAAADQVVGQLTDLAASLFLDSAVGSSLDRLVFDRYGLLRKPASPSAGSVQFKTATPSATTFTIPSGTLLQTSDGIQFITTADGIFVAGTVGPLTVAVRSVLAGANQSAKRNAISSILSAFPSQPTNISVTNQLATAGASDAETDDSLRDRARRFFTTARRGTLAALEEAALGVAGVQKATAFEAIDASGRPARLVELVVADSFTEQFVDYTTVPPAFQAQSQLLASNVFDSLTDVRPAGTFVQVTVANVIIQAFQLALTFIAGADVNATALAARAAVVNYVNTLPPGAKFVAANLLSQLKLVTGLQFTGNELVSPPGDVAVLPLQVLRTTLGLVAAVAAQGNQPIITGTNPDAFITASS